MKDPSKWFAGVPRDVLIWFIASVSLVMAAFFFFSRSLLSDMVVFVWVLSGVAVLYISKTKRDEKPLDQDKRHLFAGIGVLAALFSFINYLISPLTFWNPPYSLQEFTVLLSGLSILLFALSGRSRAILLACAFPFIIMFAAQLYDNPATLDSALLSILGSELYGRYQSLVEDSTNFMIYAAMQLSILVLNLLGIKTNVAPGYIIQMYEPDGSPRIVGGSWMQVQIVTDCSGIWSLSAYTASLLIVSLAFRNLFSWKNAGYIALGYLGTYVANILRVVAICLAVYYTGYGDFTHSVHLHAGWIAFSGWMVLFWYLFFSRRLLRK